MRPIAGRGDVRRDEVASPGSRERTPELTIAREGPPGETDLHADRGRCGLVERVVVVARQRTMQARSRVEPTERAHSLLYFETARPFPIAKTRFVDRYILKQAASKEIADTVELSKSRSVDHYYYGTSVGRRCFAGHACARHSRRARPSTTKRTRLRYRYRRVEDAETARVTFRRQGRWRVRSMEACSSRWC